MRSKLRDPFITLCSNHPMYALILGVPCQHAHGRLINKCPHGRFIISFSSACMHVFLHLISYSSGVKRTHDNDSPWMMGRLNELRSCSSSLLIHRSCHPPPHSEWSARLLGVEKINFVLHQHQSGRTHCTVAVTPSPLHRPLCNMIFFAPVPPIRYLIFFSSVRTSIVGTQLGGVLM